MEAPGIPVFRPNYLTDGVEFQPDLTESPANVFYQTVNASVASLSRMQFQWRSVSDQLLVSPVMMLRFKLKIQSPQLWNQLTSYCNVHGIQTSMQAAANVPTVGGNASAQIGVPALQFADGDALTNVASTINLSFNGTSLSLNRTNRWFRDYMRCMLASSDAARIYKSAGGAYNQYDARAVAVPVLSKGSGGTVAGNQPTGILAGIVQDSGIAERTKNLFALSVPAGLTGAPTVDEQKENVRVIQVSYPVPVPPCNPWRGAPLPSTCPMKNLPLAIPHWSAGGLDFLFEDFEKAFIRYLGTGTASSVDKAGHTNYAANMGGNTSVLPVKVSYVDKSAQLEIKYFRLSHTRTLKESYSWNMWQTQTFPALLPPTEARDGFKSIPNWIEPLKAGTFVGMDPVGKDFASLPANHDLADTSTVAAKACTVDGQHLDTKIWKVKFDTISLAQVPSFLLISAPKLSDSYTLYPSHANHDVAIASKLKASNAAKNLSNNLSIRRLRIVVNATSGAIDYSGDDTAFIDAERLFQLTCENCNSQYFKEGGFRAWRDHGCAVLLSSAQFAPGLMVSDGVSYPVSIRVECELYNRAVGISSLDTGCAHSVRTNDEKAIQSDSLQLSRDYIRAQAQCTAIFQKVVLQTTETSASSSAMNFPLDSAERIMSAAGIRR